MPEMTKMDNSHSHPAIILPKNGEPLHKPIENSTLG